MQCQDITFTLNLDDMTPNKYKEIIDFVKSVNTEASLGIHTYDPENIEKDVEPLFYP